MPDLEDTIETAATTPAEASGDGGSMKQQPIPDLIQADRYLRGKDAQSQPRRGLRLTKVIPPGM